VIYGILKSLPSHFSIQEFLVSDRILKSQAAKFKVMQDSAQYLIAKTCLSYVLQFDAADSLTADTYEKFPLARYAASSWAKHVTNCTPEDGTRRLQSLVDDILDTQKNAFSNWLRMYDPVSANLRDCTKRMRYRRSPLLCASALGFEGFLRKVLANGEDVDFRDGAGRTPLVLAASLGHARIVRLLLEEGADVELAGNCRPGIHDSAPLSAAAMSGREEVVEILLDGGSKLIHVLDSTADQRFHSLV
jgi:hypothetical protein